MSAKLTMRNSASIVASDETPYSARFLSWITWDSQTVFSARPQQAKDRGGTYQASLEPLASIKCERIGILPPVKYATQLKDCFTIPSGGAGVLRQELINHLLELSLRPGADQLLHHLPFFEEKDRRNTHDLIASGNLWVFIGVELSDLDLSGIFVGQLLDNWSDHLTGAAPDSPKIDHH